jgi:transposase-like protein
MAVERMETCEDVGELARELGVRPRCLYKWRRKLEMVEPGQEASRPSTHASAHRKEIQSTSFTADVSDDVHDVRETRRKLTLTVENFL